MPREDLREEKEYDEKNNVKEKVRIITENELLNLKLDRILTNQIELIKLLNQKGEK